MSLLSDFLNDRLPPVDPDALSRGVIGIHMKSKDEDEDEISGSEDESDDDRTELYVKKTMETYFNESRATGEMMNVTDIDISQADSEMMHLVSKPKAFQMYKFDVYHKKELPIDSYKDKVITLVNSNSVVVIDGPTGCGKTTQVPQFILDYCKEKNLLCNIVVTQPRRIAAINIAKRVCEERGWGLGEVCGYQVGLDKVVGENAILTYVTTEILLQKLILQKNLNVYTHIIIDEVHERTKSLDFLLLVARKYLFSNSPGVKIILMSATMNSDDFAFYFRDTIHSHPNFSPAPILHVTKKSQFTTSTFYMDQLSHLIEKHTIVFDYLSPTIHTKLYELCAVLLKIFNKLDEDENNASSDAVTIRSVLIFLPGYHEIDDLHQHLEKEDNKQWEIVPMHSSLPSDQLARAFAKPRVGHRKIILATNIAESSITVPDVHYIIDFCLTKNLNVNPETKFSSLTLEWASHDNCVQRAGRVGRVANGRVYRLVPYEFYLKQMSNSTLPEMQRAPLENIILYMKLLEMNDFPKNVLSLALSPPNIKDVENCIWHLKEIGALLQTCNGKKITQDGDLTHLGRIMGGMPIDVHLAKLIVLGYMFSCLNESVIMAAGCTIQNLFVMPFREKLDVFKKKLLYSDDSKSDLITMLNLYNIWKSLQNDRFFRSQEQEYSWCRKNYVNHKGLKEWELLVKEINVRLKRFKIENDMNVSRVRLTAAEKALILKVIICGAFYPNYFARFEKVDMHEAVKILSGRDPLNTVYFMNMRQNQPGKIYVRQIKDLLKTDKSQVGFDSNGSSKIFVEFKRTKEVETVSVDGNFMLRTKNCNIPSEVYEAIKKRQLRMDFPLRILSDTAAWEFMEKTKPSEQEELDEHCFTEKFNSPIPSLDTTSLLLSISVMVDAGYFYCHSATPETERLLQTITKILNNPGLKLENVRTDNIVIDTKIYAARFSDDKQLYRCKVRILLPDKKSAQVFFIDYGNTQKVSFSDIYELPKVDLLNGPDLAICCVLSEVRPSLVHSPTGIWSDRVNLFFSRLTNQRLLSAKIYSVVDNEVHLELFLQNNQNKSMNQLLIENNYAEKCQESYLSIIDHEKRCQIQNSDNPNSEAQKWASNKPDSYVDFAAPELKDCSTVINLKGPFNPLEIKVGGLMRSTVMSQVKIDDESINSVLLDDYPQDPHSRLIVAGHITQNAAKTSLRIGQTSVMPNIPGFPMLMTLLFCPTVDFKVNYDGTKIGAILCGLGTKEGSSKPCYAEHDIILNLDTTLNMDILLKVNELRVYMSRAMEVMRRVYDEFAVPDEVARPREISECQKSLKEGVFSLLELKKEDIGFIPVKYADQWHKSECDLILLKIKLKSKKDDIWPSFLFVQLNEIPEATLKIKKNLEELREIACRIAPARQIKCELCNVDLLFLGQVSAHICSEEHKRNLESFQ